MSTLDPRIVKEVHGNIIKIFLHFFGMKDMEDYLKFKPCGYNEKFQPCNYAEFVKKVKKMREEKGSDITSDDLTDLHYSIEKRIEYLRVHPTLRFKDTFFETAKIMSQMFYDYIDSKLNIIQDKKAANLSIFRTSYEPSSRGYFVGCEKDGYFNIFEGIISSQIIDGYKVIRLKHEPCGCMCDMACGHNEKFLAEMSGSNNDLKIVENITPRGYW